MQIAELLKNRGVLAGIGVLAFAAGVFWVDERPLAARKKTRPLIPVSSGEKAGERPVYPYSVVPGGVYSGKEAKEAAKKDPVVKKHYTEQGVDVDSLEATKLKSAKKGYVSYRVGDRIYWTKKKVDLAPGELVLTDGNEKIRGRCGNMISDKPKSPVSPIEPPEKDMNTPAEKFTPPAGAASIFPLQGEMPVLAEVKEAPANWWQEGSSNGGNNNHAGGSGSGFNGGGSAVGGFGGGGGVGGGGGGGGGGAGSGGAGSGGGGAGAGFLADSSSAGAGAGEQQGAGAGGGGTGTLPASMAGITNVGINGTGYNQVLPGGSGSSVVPIGNGRIGQDSVQVRSASLVSWGNDSGVSFSNGGAGSGGGGTLKPDGLVTNLADGGGSNLPSHPFSKDKNPTAQGTPATLISTVAHNRSGTDGTGSSTRGQGTATPPAEVKITQRRDNPRPEALMDGDGAVNRVAQTPEPATFALVGVALLALGLRKRGFR